MQSSTTRVIGQRLIMVRGCSGSDDGVRWVGFGWVGFFGRLFYGDEEQEVLSTRSHLVILSLFFHYGASLWNYL